jgi:SAM-dependent methyltransferase
MHAITPRYVLGHSDSELKRLATQSAFWDELTEDVLRRAGVAAGMHVLDLGSGAGDVAFIAARLTGPTGRVHGIDRSAQAVARANARATALGLSWCSFSVANVESFATEERFAPEERFDAIIGRLVLMYCVDPARTLRALARSLKAGGIVAFHEIVLNSMLSAPLVPLLARVTAWVLTAFARSGAELDMGLRLDATFRAAGLPPPELYAAARPVAGAESAGYAVLANVTRALMPAIEQFGIATAAEVDIDTLEARLREATIAADACFLSPVLVGGWARVS